MTLSVRTRFEVFKRDRFTCQYCGKHPPDVLLEADHIVPRAAGGSDDIGNLTTACTDCNRGKGGRMLEEGISPAVNADAIAEMQERIEQAKAYMETLGSFEQILKQQVWRVNEAWADAFGAERIEKGDGTVSLQLNYGGQFPNERSVKQFIKKLGLEQVLDAVDITASKFHNPTAEVCRYFYGVCHRSIREGREPLSRQSGGEAFDEGYDRGVRVENDRIRELFVNHEANGFESYADVVNALWPEAE